MLEAGHAPSTRRHSRLADRGVLVVVGIIAAGLHALSAELQARFKAIAASHGFTAEVYRGWSAADPEAPGLNYPIAEDGKIKPDWLKLFMDFQDRFIIGSDQHYPEPKGQDRRWQEDVLVFNQLPPDVRRKIGTENIVSIYGNSVASFLRAAKN